MRRILLHIALIFLLVAVFFLSLRSEAPKVLAFPPMEKKALPERPISEMTHSVPLKMAEVSWPERQPTPPKVERTFVKKAPSPKKTPAASVAGSSSGGNGGVDLVADFDCDVAFYLGSMESLGAKVVVFERQSGAFFNLSESGLTRMPKLAGDFSPVARRITEDHPSAEEILGQAKSLAGPGKYEILLLLPPALEQRYHAIVAALIRERSGSKKAAATTVFVRYRQAGEALVMWVVGMRVDGRWIEVGQGFSI